MVIYKEQAITDLAIPEQQAVVKNPLEDIATKMAETYDKEVKALNMEQDNNAKQSIQMAFETYKDDPVMFEQTVDKTIGGLSEKLRTPEDKVEFLAKAEMTKALYKNRAEINYQSKVDKQYQESYQADVDLGMASLKENLMLVHTGGKGASLVTAELGKLKTMVDKKDSKGNYLLTRTQRVKAMDLIDNAEFYGALSYAQYLKATDDNVNLDLEYSAYEKDLQGEFSPAQKIKLLEAFKPSKDDVNTYEQVQTEVGFKTTIDYMDIKDGVINNPASNMEELFNTINDLDLAYNNKQVSKQFYSSNMPKLKSTYYQMDVYSNIYEKGKSKILKRKIDTVGTTMLNTIDELASGIQDKAIKYDATTILNNVIKKTGIDPNSTDQVDIATLKGAMAKEIPTVMRKLYPQYTGNFKDEDLMQKDTQDLIIRSSIQNRTILSISKATNIKSIEALVEDF